MSALIRRPISGRFIDQLIGFFLDPNIDFYANLYPYCQVLRSSIVRLGRNARKCVCYTRMFYRFAHGVRVVFSGGPLGRILLTVYGRISIRVFGIEQEGRGGGPGWSGKGWRRGCTFTVVVVS